MGDIGQHVPARTDPVPDGSRVYEQNYVWKDEDRPGWEKFMLMKKHQSIEHAWKELKVKYMRVRDTWDVLVHLILKNGQVPNKKRKLPRYCRFQRTLFYTVADEYWPADPDLSSDSD